MSLSTVWNSLSYYVTTCCCCRMKNTSHGTHENSSQDSFSPPPPYVIFDNPVLDTESPDNFTIEALDPAEDFWQPDLRLRFHGNEFSNVDLSRNDDLDGFPGYHQHRRHVDSKSTSRESGYGPSIEESVGSSSDTEMSVGVVEAKSKATFKLIVQDQTRCWYVFRRQLEFVYVQEYLKKEVGPVGEDLPVGKRATAQELQEFVQRVASDPRALQLRRVREFLHIDRYSSSSSSSESTDPGTSVVTLQPGRRVPLNPRALAQDPPPPPLPDRGRPGHDTKRPSAQTSAVERLPSVPLGCEERRMSPSDFEFLSLIGKGSFGRVVLARRREDAKIYAVKMLSKKLIIRKNETAHVLSERSVLTRVLRNPYVVTLHFAFTTPSRIFFVLDYVNGGELFYHLQKERVFSEGRARFYAAEICCALTYMHSMGIVYRDLKPENILLDREGHVVLTDFGLCKEGIETASSRTSTFCGTPEYLAPEVILKKPYTRSVDWWTYGAVLYEMLYGLPPFYYKNTAAMYDAIIKEPLRLRSTVSTNAKGILFALLQKSPSRRLGSGPKDGNEVKRHSFFASVRWSLIEERAVPPPFVPKVTSDEDIRNIDPAFTNEPVLFPPSSPPSVHENKPFRGFSYVCPDDIEGES